MSHIGRPYRRPPPSGFLLTLSRRAEQVISLRCGTGFEPVTARSIVWCSAIELTNGAFHFETLEPMTRNAGDRHIRKNRIPAPLAKRNRLLACICYRKDVGGSRTHFELLCRQPPGRSASTSKSILARNRTRSSTFARSRANPAHSEDMLLYSVPRQGVEPRLADSKSAVLIHHTHKACLGPTTGFAPA